MKKLFAVVLCLLLATGAAYAFDTKIIDDNTVLKNLPTNIRPIGHYGTVAVPEIYGPRAVGLGYTVEDPDTYPGPSSVIGNHGGREFFFTDGTPGAFPSTVGISDEKNILYINAKRDRLAAGLFEGDLSLNLQQAESTAVWRAIPMPTGSFMRICYTDVCCPTITTANYQFVGQRWGDQDVLGSLMNEWHSAKPSLDPLAPVVYQRTGIYEGYWGNKYRTPAVDQVSRYGYAVPRIESRNIVHDYFKTYFAKSGNPGTNVGTDGDPATIGQETMTSVFLWSADMSAGPDGNGVTGDLNTVAVMVRLDNDLYKGMKVGDFHVLKVEENKSDRQFMFTLVESESALRNQTFAVVKRTTTLSCESATFKVKDEVLKASDIIQAGNRTTVEEGKTPCDAKCDVEWETMQYFVLIAVQKESALDVADAAYDDVVGSLNLIVAQRPFTKTPNIRCGYPAGSEPRFGWVLGNRANAVERYDGFTRDPFLADTLGGVKANFGYEDKAGYPKAVLDAMEKWNEMSFVKDSVVETYGFKDAIVYKLPAVRAAKVGNTAVVMYTIRIGHGEKELAPESIVGKTPAEIRAIDVGGELAEDMGEFTRVSDCRDLKDGTFAILKKDAVNHLVQDVMPDDEQFVADGVYFVALAVQDRGDFDHDKYNPIPNNQSWVSPAFLVFGGVTPNTLRVDPSSAKVLVGETKQFEAKVTTGDVPAVTWESSDTAVATVDENGLATAVAVGTATITATPEAGSDFTPATATLTVEQPAPPSGGSGGGCSVGGFGPASLFLLAPLFLLLKK